jgi:hypothetical protein
VRQGSNNGMRRYFFTTQPRSHGCPQVNRTHYESVAAVNKGALKGKLCQFDSPRCTSKEVRRNHKVCGLLEQELRVTREPRTVRQTSAESCSLTKCPKPTHCPYSSGFYFSLHIWENTRIAGYYFFSRCITTLHNIEGSFVCISHLPRVIYFACISSPFIY